MPNSNPRFLESDSAIAQMICAKDWSDHPIGPPLTWPLELKTTVSLILNSPFPMFISWGEHRTFFYNDAYRPILGTKKHPQALGACFQDIWYDIWEDIEPIVLKVERGSASYMEDLPLYMDRSGEFEQTYFTFSYSPVKDIDGHVLGLFCACVETTKRIQTEEELAKSHQATLAERADLVDTLESMSDAFFSIDKNWKIIRVNSHHEKITQIPREEQIGRDVREVFFADPIYKDSIYLKSYIEAMEQRKPVVFEDYYEALDLWTDVRVYPKAGGGLAVFFTDSTEKKKNELLASKAKKEFEKNLDVSPAILWITERDGSCTYLSKQWYEFTGQTQEEALGFGWLDATHPDDKQRTAKIYMEANEKQKPFYAEYRLKTKNGDYRWAIDTANPRYDKDGNYLGYAGAVFDIHEQKIATEQIKDMKYRFDRSAEATNLGVWYCDLPFDVLIWNDEVKRHFFLPSDAHVTIDVFYEGIHPDDRAQTQAAIQHSIDTHSSYDTTYRTTNPKDPEETKYIRAVGWTDYDSQGVPIRFDGITLDVTLQFLTNQELKSAKEDAERAREEAEHANSLKSAFLANMSHEIRTPLGAMMGFADLLRDPSLTPSERQSFINILSRNGEGLSVIINDILDLSKVEAGHLTLEYADTFPDQIGADVVSLLRVKANEKDLVLEYTHDENSAHSIVADPTRVRQILLNLVSNAIKFTQFGSVTLRSYSCKTQLGRDALCFEVSDTGIGLSADQHERIFEMFVQADGSMTRRFGGTGLGLALSRSLARTMGGDIVVVDSQEGVGSTFLVTIEDQPERRNDFSNRSHLATKIPHELPDRALDGMKILVVDDAPDNQQLIWRYLTKHGAIVESAENGLIGYRSALTGDFDLVLMDIQMPVMDGYAATQKLREAGYRQPIVALTAHAMNEVRRKALNVGYTDHLTKPINLKELITTLARHRTSSTVQA